MAYLQNWVLFFFLSSCWLGQRGDISLRSCFTSCMPTIMSSHTHISLLILILLLFHVPVELLPLAHISPVFTHQAFAVQEVRDVTDESTLYPNITDCAIIRACITYLLPGLFARSESVKCFTYPVLNIGIRRSQGPPFYSRFPGFLSSIFSLVFLLRHSLAAPRISWVHTHLSLAWHLFFCPTLLLQVIHICFSLAPYQ